MQSTMRVAPGGASSICLGGDAPGVPTVSSNRFANGANQNAGNFITDRPSTRVHHGPGGASSICLGEDPAPSGVQARSPQHQPVKTPQATAAAAAPAETNISPKQAFAGTKAVSSNCFANGANQNAGNFITDRPSTRVHHGPGGASSICLGEDPAPSGVQARAPQHQRVTTPQDQARPAERISPKQASTGTEAVSSNRFANGANQNAGNFITDRPSTRVHHGPGGASSICLGEDPAPSGVQARSPQHQRVTTPQDQARPAERISPKQASTGTEAVSSNRFANGANQNAGNFITDRPSTRVHYGPGGASSICLGDDTDSFRKASGDRSSGMHARRGAA